MMAIQTRIMLLDRRRELRRHFVVSFSPANSWASSALHLLLRLLLRSLGLAQLRLAILQSLLWSFLRHLRCFLLQVAKIYNAFRLFLWLGNNVSLDDLQSDIADKVRFDVGRIGENLDHRSGRVLVEIFEQRSETRDARGSGLTSRLANEDDDFLIGSPLWLRHFADLAFHLCVFGALLRAFATDDMITLKDE